MAEFRLEGQYRQSSPRPIVNTPTGSYNNYRTPPPTDVAPQRVQKRSNATETEKEEPRSGIFYEPPRTPSSMTQYTTTPRPIQYSPPPLRPFHNVYGTSSSKELGIRNGQNFQSSLERKNRPKQELRDQLFKQHLTKLNRNNSGSPGRIAASSNSRSRVVSPPNGMSKSPSTKNVSSSFLNQTRADKQTTQTRTRQTSRGFMDRRSLMGPPRNVLENYLPQGSRSPDKQPKDLFSTPLLGSFGQYGVPAAGRKASPPPAYTQSGAVRPSTAVNRSLLDGNLSGTKPATSFASQRKASPTATVNVSTELRSTNSKPNIFSPFSNPDLFAGVIRPTNREPSPKMYSYLRPNEDLPKPKSRSPPKGLSLNRTPELDRTLRSSIETKKVSQQVVERLNLQMLTNLDAILWELTHNTSAKVGIL